MRPSRWLLPILMVPAMVLAPPAASSWPAATDSLAPRWERAMQDLHIPGMAVVAVRDTGIVRLWTLGLRDVEHALPVTPETRFYIASCTKPVVATAAALLAADGRLDLDAPVRTYLPEFSLADSGLADSVTTRDLLCHRYGLASWALTLGEAYTGQMTDERFYRLLGRVTSQRRFRYSNLHYTITGRVMEAVTGRTWKQVVADRVFGPAGMTRATCSAVALRNDPDAATPYLSTGGEPTPSPTRKVDATMHAAGGVAASIIDLARLLRVELGNGTIDGRSVMPAAALRATRAPLVPEAAEGHPLLADQRRVAWGAGWDIRLMRGDTLHAHNGQFAGAAACLGYLPEHDLGVAVVVNGSGPAVIFTEMVVQDVLDAVMGAEREDPLPKLLMFAARGAPPAAPSDPGRPERAPGSYAGRYENDDWGTIDIVARGDGLQAQMGALPLPLRWGEHDRVEVDDQAGRFEFGSRGKAKALWIRMAPGDSVRFVRS